MFSYLPERCFVLGKPERAEGEVQQGRQDTKPAQRIATLASASRRAVKSASQKPCGTAISKNYQSRLRLAIPYLLTCFPHLSLIGQNSPQGCDTPCTFGLGTEALLSSCWESQSSVGPALGLWDCCGFSYSEHDEVHTGVWPLSPEEGSH